MTLIRQIWLLLLGVVLLALAGSVFVSVVSTRDTLQTELKTKNADAAQALAVALSQQHGDEETMALLMSAQFDTGHYRSIRMRRPDGRTLFQRAAADVQAQAPGWFVRLLPIAAEAGIAQVSDGWRQLGSVEVASPSAYAHDQLWRAAGRSLGWLCVVGVLAAVLARFAVKRLERPIAATVAQAEALAEGRYLTVAEPAVPELRRLSVAMNSMVERLRQLFEAQAAQTEALRRQAYCDPLTGLPHRAHFLERLGSLLQREDGVDGGGLVLVRIGELGSLNLLLGRESTDHALSLVAKALQAYPERVADCFVGRLNGSDFALCLPAPEVAAETAQSLAAALKASLSPLGSGVRVHLGAVELRRGQGVGALLAQADLALARSESKGPFAVEVAAPEPLPLPPGAPVQGERSWRVQVGLALEHGRAKLVEFPVIDRRGQMVHLECPLRLQLEESGPWEPAARWLPLAARSRLTARTDAHALTLALTAIAADGRPRAISVAAGSLADGGFAAHVRSLVQDVPHLAPRLWLEVDEAVAAAEFDRVQEFGRLLRPLGVRYGLEHAGQRLHRIDRLFELGLDYVKLDAALCSGIASHGPAREFVKSSVAVLHALSLQVQAEGVRDGAGVEALWACGLDAVTGPWATARAAAVA